MAYDPKLGYDPNKDYSLAIVNAGSDEERERLRQERQQLRVQLLHMWMLLREW